MSFIQKKQRHNKIKSLESTEFSTVYKIKNDKSNKKKRLSMITHSLNYPPERLHKECSKLNDPLE